MRFQGNIYSVRWLVGEVVDGRVSLVRCLDVCAAREDLENTVKDETTSGQDAFGETARRQRTEVEHRWSVLRMFLQQERIWKYGLRDKVIDETAYGGSGQDAFGETASWQRPEVIDGRVSLVRSLDVSAAREDLEIRLGG